MFVLFKKELNSFFSSLTGYIAIIVFLVLTGLFLWVFPGDFNILENGFANIEGLFIIAPWVFLFLIPAITMRLFSEENKTGTIELLLTKPLSDLKIILAKYFAGLTVVAFSLLPTLVYFISVYLLGNPVGNIDVGGTWGSFRIVLFSCNLCCYWSFYIIINIKSDCCFYFSNAFFFCDLYRLRFYFGYRFLGRKFVFYLKIRN